MERNSKTISVWVTTLGTAFLMSGTFGVSVYGNQDTLPIQLVGAVVPAAPYAAAPQVFDMDRTLTEARKAIAARDLRRAEQLLQAATAHAERSGFTFRESDDQPRFVAPLLEQSKRLAAEMQTSGYTEANRRQYAQLALVQADGFLRKGELEIAHQLTQEAAAQGVIFNEAARTSGMEPNAMSQRIEAARITRQTASTAAYRTDTDSTRTQQVRDYELRIPARTPAIPSAENPETTLVDHARQKQQLAVQQVAADIMQYISDAQRTHQERGDTDAALQILQRAKSRLEEAKLDPQTQASFLRNIDTAIQNIEKSSQRYSHANELNQANTQVLSARRAEQEENLAIQQKLKTYVEECNRCLDEGRWNDAVVIAKKARDLAPEDPVTHQLVLVAQLVSRTKRYDEIRANKEEAFTEAMLSIDKASIPWTDNAPIQFPSSWATLKNTRRGTDEITNNRPESEREILRRLEMPISLRLDRPVPFSQVMQLLRAQSGVQIFPQESALREVDVTGDTLVRFPITSDITLRSALNLILDPLGLAFVVENEVLNITTAARKNQSRMYPKVYYVGDLIHPVPNSDGSSPHSLESAHQRGMNRAMEASETINGVRRSTNVSMNGMPITSNNPTNDRIYAQTGGGYTGFGTPATGNTSGQDTFQGGNGAANFGDITDTINTIIFSDPDLTGDEWSISEYGNNGSLIIRTTEDFHAQISDLLAQLRKLSDLQITIEVRYVTLRDGYAERMGVDFDVNLPNNAARSRYNGNNPAIGTQSLSNYFNGRTVTSSDPSTMQDNRGTLDLSIAQDSFATSLTPPFGGATGNGLSLGFAILSDIETYFFLSAAQSNARSNVMEAPKVTLFNGQRGSINDTTSRPYVTSVIPVVGDFAAAYQPVVSIFNEGQILNVQGTVTSDRRFVRLTLNPVINVVNKVETYKYFGSDELTEDTGTVVRGDDNTASTDEKREKQTRSRTSQGITVQQPITSSFNVNTTVNVPDGGTIVMGGIKRLAEGRNESGVPMLSKIPYLKRLFQNTAIGRDSTSVMMVVTPRIIIQEEEEAHIGYTTP